MFHFSLLVKAKCSSNKIRQGVELQKKISMIKNSRSGTKKGVYDIKAGNQLSPLLGAIG